MWALSSGSATNRWCIRALFENQPDLSLHGFNVIAQVYYLSATSSHHVDKLSGKLALCFQEIIELWLLLLETSCSQNRASSFVQSNKCGSTRGGYIKKLEIDGR